MINEFKVLFTVQRCSRWRFESITAKQTTNSPTRHMNCTVSAAKKRNTVETLLLFQSGIDSSVLHRLDGSKDVNAPLAAINISSRAFYSETANLLRCQIISLLFSKKRKKSNENSVWRSSIFPIMKPWCIFLGGGSFYFSDIFQCDVANLPITISGRVKISDWVHGHQE